MHADYIANPLYGNNPFIEALPPMLSGKDLIRALAVIPPYSDSDRDRSTGERLQLLSSLYEFYQPLSMTIDLYCEVYTAMQHCYGQYCYIILWIPVLIIEMALFTTPSLTAHYVPVAGVP